MFFTMRFVFRERFHIFGGKECYLDCRTLKTDGYECQVTSHIQHISLLLKRTGGGTESYS